MLLLRQVDRILVTSSIDEANELFSIPVPSRRALRDDLIRGPLEIIKFILEKSGKMTSYD